MQMTSTSSSGIPQLRYLSATCLEGPIPRFARLEVLSADDRTIGRLDGIVVDPIQRRVRYFVVDDGRFLRHHRYLLPFCPTRLDVERRALSVEVDQHDLESCDTFDPAQFPRFSDDDLLDALFPPNNEVRHA